QCASNYGERVDIYAAGNNLWSLAFPGNLSYTNYAMGGTSGATPLVAAAVALLREADPALTPAEIRQIIRTTGHPTGNLDIEGGREIVRLDAAAAICAAHTICGNGRVDHVCAEVCDGTNVDGQSCKSLGYAAGTLGCRGDCKAIDTSQCIAAVTPTPT